MRVLLLILMLGLAFAPRAQAQNAEVVAIFEEAERLYNIRDYSSALTKYKEVYLITGEPAILYNMAQCYRLLQKREDALSTYQTYLRLVPDSPARVNVERFIAQLKIELEAQPKVIPTAPRKSKLPLILYSVSGASVIGAGVTGALFFVSRGEIQTLADEPNSLLNPALPGLIQKTKLVGTLSNVCVVAALASGAGGLLLSTKKKKTELIVTTSGIALYGSF